MKMFAISKERKFVMWVCGLVACVLAFIFEVAGCATVAWKVVRKQWLYGAYKFVEYDIVIRTGLWRGTYCVNTKCHMWEFGEPELEIPPHKSSSQGLVVAAIVFSFLAIVAMGVTKVTSVYTYINIGARIGAIVGCVLSFILALIPCVIRGNDKAILLDSLDFKLEDSANRVLKTSILLPYSILLCAMGAALSLIAALIMTSDLLFRGRDDASQFDTASESGSMMNYSYTSYPSDDGRPGGGKGNGQIKRKPPPGSRDDLYEAEQEPYEKIFSVSDTHLYRSSTPEMYGSSRTVDSAKVLQKYAMENALRDSGLALSHRSDRSHPDLESEHDDGANEKRNVKKPQETNVVEESPSDSKKHPQRSTHYAKRKDGHKVSRSDVAATKDRNTLDKSLTSLHDSMMSDLDKASNVSERSLDVAATKNKNELDKSLTSLHDSMMSDKASNVSDRSLDADIDFENTDYSDVTRFPPPPLSFRPIILPSAIGHVQPKIEKTQKHLVTQLVSECPSGRQSEDLERDLEPDFPAMDENAVESVQETSEVMDQVKDTIDTNNKRHVQNDTSHLETDNGVSDTSDLDDDEEEDEDDSDSSDSDDSDHYDAEGVTNKAFEYNESTF